METALDIYQKKVVESLKENKNVMALGIAGSGKSYLISNLKKLLPEKEIFLTSTTGVSAINISGKTFHSFFGVGLGKANVDVLLSKILSNKAKVRLLQKENILVVVDEISMLSGSLLEKINEILKRVRYSPELFGGLQFLFSGDFLQLESINSANVLESDLIKDFTKIHLKCNYRQKGDPQFQKILESIRLGGDNLSQEEIEILKSKEISMSDINKYPSHTILFPVNSMVVKFNKEKINDLEAGEFKEYQSTLTGSCKFSKKKLEDFLIKKDSLVLKLKLGVRVMLTWNVDTACGLVNGSTGKVYKLYRNSVDVIFDGITGVINIETVDWKIENDFGSCVAKISQIPLVVCYAMTIHKSQGATLDKAIIDIGGCFCNHQVYVAMSRVRSLDGIQLINFLPNKIKVNKDIVRIYNEM
jgi:ATP-dependent DNA helicase PIF1